MDINDFALKLKSTETELLKTIKPCTLQQLTLKQRNGWSILEIIEHIYLTENVIYEITLKPSAHTSVSKEIIGANQIKGKLLEQRKQKIETLESLKPIGGFSNLETAENTFLKLREKFKTELQSGKICIDNRIFKHPFLGDMTISDWLNFLIYHTQRHIEQIKDNLKNINLKYVLIIHEVENYQAWKKVFDKASIIRKEAGEISYQVLKYDSNPNKIVHFSVWSSHENAKKFFESPRLIQIRIDAGVKTPDFIYLEELENGIL
jgi:quinol monooxygenase YgiN